MLYCGLKSYANVVGEIAWVYSRWDAIPNLPDVSVVGCLSLSTA